MDTEEKLFIFMAHFSTKVRKIIIDDPIMNQLNKNILREEIQWLLEAIAEQFEAIKAYEDKIPQIEFDIIMENIRKLYENLHMLNRENDPLRQTVVPQTEKPEMKPIRPEEDNNVQPPVQEIKPESRPTIRIKVDPEFQGTAKKEHFKQEKEESEIDLFSTESNGFAEKLQEARQKSFATDKHSSQNKELKASISINEKFLFINELFDGNLREYNITIETLNGFSELRQALEYLDLLRLKNLWESESSAFIRLRELVEQKF
jgi:hypothetical protein